MRMEVVGPVGLGSKPIHINEVAFSNFLAIYPVAISTKRHHIPVSVPLSSDILKPQCHNIIHTSSINLASMRSFV